MDEIKNLIDIIKSWEEKKDSDINDLSSLIFSLLVKLGGMKNEELLEKTDK